MSMWIWQRIHPGRPAMSGELGKQFKNETTKQPGVIRIGAPPPDATVLAREAIQNSWDAGRVLQEQLEADDVEAPPFQARFIYRALTGSDKADFVTALALPELADRARSVPRRDLGLAESDCLDHLADPSVPLTTLTLEEHGTTGMDGSWQQSRSKLSLALMSSGMTAKGAGAGGSYGYGKAGLIRGSAPRVLVAHTCFRPSDDEPEITRRLLGATYWGNHRLDELPYSGFALLGEPEHDDLVAPLANDAADDLAERLGLMHRDPDELDDLGSTFVLIEPTVLPEDLCAAIERNWWPAILDGLIDVTIEPDDGKTLHPRPRRDEVLSAFIRGYEVATTPQDNQDPQEFRRDLGGYTPVGGSSYRLGDVGLVADRSGWSFTNTAEAEDEGEGAIAHKSLVALVRGPRMVVEYYEVPGGQPYVRGAFVAHGSIDSLLRETEPKAHDAWQTTQEEGTHRDAAKVASETLKRLRRAVRDFKKQLRPNLSNEQELRLPFLDSLFRDLVENSGPNNPPPPPGDPRPISISVQQSVEPAAESPEEIRLTATATLHLTENVAEASAPVRITLRAGFDEDGARGDDCPLVVEGPRDFRREEDTTEVVLLGTLSKEPLSIGLHSGPYDPDWSVQLVITADLVKDDGLVEAAKA